MGLAVLLGLSAVLLGPQWNLLRGQTLYAASQALLCELPAALGFLLALRCGAVDLSVWASMGAGGITAALLLQHGVAAWPAMWTGVGAGAAIGVFNAILTAGAKLPAPAITLAVAIAASVVSSTVFPQKELPVPPAAFDGWHVALVPPESDNQAAGQADNGGERETVQPLTFTRVLLVAAVFFLIAALLLAWRLVSLKPLPPRLSTAAALIASGALAAAGGALWLLEYGSAPLPRQVIGDLRIPAAAVLAGGAFFTGRGRALLACLCLPPALLCATTWRQQAWIYLLGPYELQSLLLLAMVLFIQIACIRSYRGGQFSPRRLLAAGAMAAGLLLFAAAANFWADIPRRILHVGGLAVWLAGMALALWPLPPAKTARST